MFNFGYLQYYGFEAFSVFLTFFVSITFYLMLFWLFYEAIQWLRRH